jgi:hypothetical protein
VTCDIPLGQQQRVVPDPLLAVAVFLILGATYVATLLPGLGGTEDTAKFQYIGPALGTPHEPGYPLYMIVSWAASKLPLGTLAYRINLLSAFWGATAAAFVFLMMRRIGVSRVLAVSVALGLGLGRTFWEHSTYAEVYTQACAFSAAALLALLAWDEEGRDRDLYAAVAATSLAFGTHLIILGAVPLFAWFVLTRYRWRLPSRVIAVSGLIVTLGIAQYGYVWIRTVQRSVYLEARASSIGELLATLRGRQFEGQTFKEPPLVIARSRIPHIAMVVRDELGIVATIGSVVGLLAQWRRRRRSAILLAGAFLGPALLLSMLGEVATAAIILPALMPLWALVGAGAAGLWARAASVPLPQAARIAAFAAIALLAAAIPATQARTNFAHNNRRGNTFDTMYFTQLYSQIAARSAFLAEHYVVGHMLEYQKYVTRTPHVLLNIPRDPEVIARLVREGFAVYGFGDAIAALDGRVTVRGVTLWAPTLNARLADLPNGFVVVVAGSAQRWPLLDAIDVDRVRPSGRGVIVAVKGFGPVIETPPDFEGRVDIRRGQPLGESGLISAMDVHVELRGADTTIEAEGQPVVRSTGGLAVAEIASRVFGAYVLSSGNAYRPPLDMGRRPLFQITGVPVNGCTEVGDGKWRPLADPGSTGRLAGRIDNFRAFDATWVVYLAAEQPLPARLLSWVGRREPALDVQAFMPGRDTQRLRSQLAEDDLDAPPELLSAPVVVRLGVKVNDEGQSTAFRVGLGGRPSAGWGRAVTDQQTLQRGSVCALPLDLLEPGEGTGRAALHLGPGGDWMFSPEWQGARPAPLGFHRMLRGAEGRLLLPSAEPAPITLRMSVEPIGGDAIVGISLNGGAPIQATRPATAGWNELRWTIPVDEWRAGVNELSIQVRRRDGLAPPVDEPSVRVRAIEFDWTTR